MNMYVNLTITLTMNLTMTALQTFSLRRTSELQIYLSNILAIWTIFWALPWPWP